MNNPLTNHDVGGIAFKSIRKSYFEARVAGLSFERSIKKVTEYFLTVNLHKELCDWSLNNNHKYKIEAEKPTSDFYQNCFELFKLEKEDNIFSETLFSSNSKDFFKNLSSIRSGKIDITISKNTNSFNDIAEYLIEVKSINPNMAKLKQDFDRIQKYLNAKIPKFENSLRSGFIVFIVYINNERKIQYEEELLRKEEIYLSKITKHLSKISFDNMLYSISRDYIDYSPYEKLGSVDSSDDYSEIAISTYSVFSVVIEIKNKIT